MHFCFKMRIGLYFLVQGRTLDIFMRFLLVEIANSQFFIGKMSYMTVNELCRFLHLNFQGE